MTSRSVVRLKTERSSVRAKTPFVSLPEGPDEIFSTLTGAICCAGTTMFSASAKATTCTARIYLISLLGLDEEYFELKAPAACGILGTLLESTPAEGRRTPN